MNRRRQAKRLLVNYISQTFSASGVEFSSDCRTEVETIIDLIFDEIDSARAEVTPAWSTVGQDESNDPSVEDDELEELDAELPSSILGGG